MKTIQEIKQRLKAELDQWFVNQVKHPYDNYYLYYRTGGGFVIYREAPPNPDYKLGISQAISKNLTIEQNFNALYPLLLRLPILEP